MNSIKTDARIGAELLGLDGCEGLVKESEFRILLRVKGWCIIKKWSIGIAPLMESNGYCEGPISRAL
jgi:hypothetical protein